ncbi:hypothetical protein [Paracoccus sp. AK26]|uniref:hypothetical protein n=1 Tax=Paracoccus sp. AK26 TaxID=2589076 RepID=UPI0014282653|nr:hypothetical protein [Paracoccus sp. AK26]QIR87108.1 hypothetical protein FIU66_17705 [Paracoccus sp. AK26]
MPGTNQEIHGAPLETTDPEGILPDGVRGTTRDTAYTRPADEHAGYKDPTEPDLRKPSEQFEDDAEQTPKR